MTTSIRATLAASCIIPALVCVYGAAQQSTNSFSEEELIRLIRMGVTASTIVSLVQKWGIDFKPDGPTLARLKKKGAPDALLEAIRRAAPHGQPKAPAVPETVRPAPPSQRETPAIAPPEETAKRLVAERHLRLSQLKAHDKDFDGALAELAEAEKVRPQWGQVFYRRGLVFADLRRYAEAANEWKKYLTVAGAEADVKTVQDKIVEWGFQGEKDEKERRLKGEGERNFKDFNAAGAKDQPVVQRTIDLPLKPPTPPALNISVTTQPPSATIYADSAPMNGKTPLSFHLSPGHHTLIIFAEGYRPVRREIDLPEDGVLTVNVTLSRQ